MRKTKNDGYLLLEVIVAVAILSTGLLFAIRAMSAAARAEEYFQGYSQALLLLGEKTRDIVLPPVAASAGRTAVAPEAEFPAKGDFGDSAEGYTWSADVVQDKNLPGKWARVNVCWTKSQKERCAASKVMVEAAPPVAATGQVVIEQPDGAK